AGGACGARAAGRCGAVARGGLACGAGGLARCGEGLGPTAARGSRRAVFRARDLEPRLVPLLPLIEEPPVQRFSAWGGSTDRFIYPRERGPRFAGSPFPGMLAAPFV